MQRSSYVMVDTIQMSSVMSITRIQDDWVVMGNDDLLCFEWKSLANKVKMNGSGWNIINYPENKSFTSADKNNGKKSKDQLKSNMKAGPVWSSS